MKSKSESGADIGPMVRYRASKDETFPMIVTRINKDGSFNGQVFMDGTEVKYVANAVMGDDAGQCVSS